MRILGISAFYHDAAAALLVDGELVAAAQEERFTRKKYDASFPTQAAAYCLQEGGITLAQVDEVVFYDKPLLKFERLLTTYHAYAPKGLRSFLKAIPVWLEEKLFHKRLLRQGLATLPGGEATRPPLYFTEHHLSHAASAFYPSSYTEAAILTIDGVGEWATASICQGQGAHLRILQELPFPHSLGLLYSAFTYYLGFRVNSGEYKLMGLAPYGNPGSPEVARYKQLIYDKLITLYDDGSLVLHQAWFGYATGLRMVPDARWAGLFGFPRREAEAPLQQHHMDLALAIQQVTEEVVLKMAHHAHQLTGSRNLCLAGGVALNCVANGRLLAEGPFQNVWIQPAAGDAGGALGAALAAHHLRHSGARSARHMPQTHQDGMQGSYLGPSILPQEVTRLRRRYQAPAIAYNDTETLAGAAAALLAKGQVLGWARGRMEYGPRALGARSILADPRSPEMQKRLNLKIKNREGFRPFAPAILAEDVATYFELEQASPYMLLVRDIRPALRNALPEDYAQRDLAGKLYFTRSSLPAITHIDFSARIQTVHRETNPAFHALLSAFKAETGCPVLINTSFNVRGEPIVCTAEDAYRCFMTTDIDALVLGPQLFLKAEQPTYHLAPEHAITPND